MSALGPPVPPFGLNDIVGFILSNLNAPLTLLSHVFPVLSLTPLTCI